MLGTVQISVRKETQKVRDPISASLLFLSLPPPPSALAQLPLLCPCFQRASLRSFARLSSTSSLADWFVPALWLMPGWAGGVAVARRKVRRLRSQQRQKLHASCHGHFLMADEQQTDRQTERSFSSPAGSTVRRALPTVRLRASCRDTSQAREEQHVVARGMEMPVAVPPGVNDSTACQVPGCSSHDPTLYSLRLALVDTPSHSPQLRLHAHRQPRA